MQGLAHIRQTLCYQTRSQHSPAGLYWTLGYREVYFQMEGDLRKGECLP